MWYLGGRRCLSIASSTVRPLRCLCLRHGRASIRSVASVTQGNGGDVENEETPSRYYREIYQQSPHIPYGLEDPCTSWMQYFYRTKHVDFAKFAFHDMLHQDHAVRFSGRNQLQMVVFWSHVLLTCHSAEQMETLYNDLRMTLANMESLPEDRTIECMEAMLRMLYMASRQSPQNRQTRERLQPILDDIAQRVHELGLTDVHVTDQLGFAQSNEHRGIESAQRRVNSVWPGEASHHSNVEFWPNPALPNAEQTWIDSVHSEEVPSWAMSTYHYFLAKTLREQKAKAAEENAAPEAEKQYLQNLSSAKLIAGQDIVNAWWSEFFGSGNPASISSITDVASLWSEFEDEYSLQHVLTAGEADDLPKEFEENSTAALRFTTSAYAFRTLAIYCQYHPAVYEALEAQILRLGEAYTSQSSDGNDDSTFMNELARPLQFLMKYRQLFLERRLAGLRWAHSALRECLHDSLPNDLKENVPGSLGPLLKQAIAFSDIVRDIVGGDRSAFTARSLCSIPTGANDRISLPVRVATEVPTVTKSIFEGNLQNDSIKL